MKKSTILLRAFLIAPCTTLLVSCSSLKGGFTITGEAETTNHVYLVSTLPDAPDTLASQPVENGTFTITGKVEQPLIARLLFRDKQEEKTLFLENNTTYTLKDGRVETPGETQKLIDQFRLQANRVHRFRPDRGCGLSRTIITC
jgi:hypothetical protein